LVYDNEKGMILSVAVILLAGPNDSYSKGKQVTSKRLPRNTAVNAAFALGPNREATSSYNNGGLENAIRFLEDWGGRTFQYRGSIVGLWHNQQSTADHRCCGSSGTNYYNAPNRDWGYDTLFDTAQPPGTPKGVLGLTRVAWSDPIGLRSKKHHLVVTSDRKGSGIIKLGRQICSLFIRLIRPMELALRSSHQEGCILNGWAAG